MSDTDLIVKLMEAGFKGVHDRLDRVNGRLNTHGAEIDSLKESRASARGAAWMGGIVGATLGSVLAWLASNLWERSK